MEKLIKEIRSSFRSDEDIDFDKASRLEYLMAVLNKSLRLFPPVATSIPRVTIDADVIDGHVVPPGVCASSVASIGPAPTRADVLDRPLSGFLNSQHLDQRRISRIQTPSFPSDG